MNADDPGYGYRFIADELPVRGINTGENRVAWLCSNMRIWSTHRARHAEVSMSTCFIRVSMASRRDAAKTLAITPDAVATMARMTVNHTPVPPSAGRSASARLKSSAARISG